MATKRSDKTLHTAKDEQVSNLAS